MCNHLCIHALFKVFCWGGGWRFFFKMLSIKKTMGSYPPFLCSLFMFPGAMIRAGCVYIQWIIFGPTPTTYIEKGRANYYFLFFSILPVSYLSLGPRKKRYYKKIITNLIGPKRPFNLEHRTGKIKS